MASQSILGIRLIFRSGNPENGIDHTVGDQAGTTKDCAAGDAGFLGIGHRRCLLAVGRQDQRGIHAAGKASAGEAVREVLGIGQNGSLCVGEEGLGDVHRGVVPGGTLDSLGGAVSIRPVAEQ